MEHYDKIIIGAGLYGLYSALLCGQKGERVVVLECDDAPFKRATYINQARVHQGYHYPRSLSTALKSAGYFERFMKDYRFCVHESFEKVYATSAQYSWSNAEQFVKFCKAANIPCTPLHPSCFFKNGMCDGAFLTREYTYDADILKHHLLGKIANYKNITLHYGVSINTIEKWQDVYALTLSHEQKLKTPYLLNATYASTNQILHKLGLDGFKIKYELCEIILCEVNDHLKNYGITVMDGPFFSIMPFGKTGYHSLTSVTFTPHTTSYDTFPTFACQKQSEGYCSPSFLGNCNECKARPKTAFPYMANLARKYLKEDFEFQFNQSLFSMKPILMSSEIDDSRPTVIKTYTQNPTLVSVLSGKINTVYDLDEVL